MRAHLPRPLLVLVAAYLGLAILFATAVPLWEAPDAVWHYLFAAHLAAGNGLPTRADEGVDAPWRQQGSQPPLYYLATAPLIALVGPSDADTAIKFNPHAAVGVAGPGGNVNRMVHYARERALPWRGTILAARLVSLAGVLFGLVAVLATWAFAREVFPDRPAVALAAAGLLAFNPEFLFFSGSISNDIAIAAAGALVLWRAAVVLRRGATRRGCVWLGVACGLALLTKLSGLWLLPVAGGAILWAVWRDERGLREGGGSEPATEVAPQGAARRRSAFADGVGRWLRGLVRPMAWFGVPMLLVAGWWYLRNLLLFGDPTGLPLMLSVMQPRALPPTWRELAVQMAAVWRSYWAVFGWFNVPAPDWVYLGATVLTLLGLGGLAVMLVRRCLKRGEVEGLALAAGAVALMVVALVSWAQVRYPQGRLFFPAAPALCLLVGAGWAAGRSERAGTWVAAGISGGIAMVALGLLFGVIRPAYARQAVLNFKNPSGPFWKTAFVVPESGEQLGWMGGGIKGERTVQPGQLLDVDLSWYPVTPLHHDYSIFLHVIDEHGLIVAQRDTFPQSGRAPTSDWMPERWDGRWLDLHGPLFYFDPHAFAIPATTEAPCDCRLVMGVYDHATGERLLTEEGRDHIDLGELRIEPAVSAEGIPNPLNVPFGDDIALAGYNLDHRAVRAGEKFNLTLFWKALRTPPMDYKVSVQLRRGQAETWAQHDEEPADGSRPSSAWQPGEIVDDLHPVLVYPEAPPGVYTMSVTLYDPETGQPVPVKTRDVELSLGSFKVLPAATASPTVSATPMPPATPAP